MARGRGADIVILINMTLKTFIAGFGIVGAVLAIALGLGGWKYLQMKKGMASGGGFEPTEFVQMATATVGPFQRTMTAVGTVQAIQHVTIANEVVGKVLSVGFESGQVVEQGHVLLTLDSATEQADLKSLQAMTVLAKASYERWSQVMESNAGSKQELDKAKAELDQSMARVEQLKAIIEKKEIRAPFRGRVGLRDTHPGQYLAEGTRITTFQGLDENVYVDFSMPQARAVATPVGAKVTVLVMGHELDATVTAVDAQIDLATRNARVRATMPSFQNRLVPGMFVDVRIPLGEAQDVVKVPTSAVRRAPFGDFVFVISPEGKDAHGHDKLKAHQRFVKVAGSMGQDVIIGEGLKARERIAADGSFKLREGVTVMEPPPPPPPGGATPASNAEATQAKAAG